MALEHPSLRTLLGSTDQEILDVAEQVYKGLYEVAPSILPCRQQDQFMAELHGELGQCLVRAGLQGVTGTAQSLSRERRHLWACSSSQARSPSVESRRKEVAKQLRGDSQMRSLWPGSRGSRSRVQQHQSQSPKHQQVRHLLRLAQDPTSVPCHLHTSHAHTTWMNSCTTLLSKLHLQPHRWESRRKGLARCSQTAL